MKPKDNNVDIDNFHQVRLEIQNKKLIQRSKCISYDLEFTGVKFEGNERERNEQLPWERYTKMRTVVSKFNIIQLGLTFFTHDDGKITAHPYNFYLFPREYLQKDPVICMQSGTADFNSKQNMDWTRWISKGITYVKIQEIEEIKEKMSKFKGFEEMMEIASQENEILVKELMRIGQKLSQRQKIHQINIPKGSSSFIKKCIDRHIESTSKANFTLTILDKPCNEVDKVIAQLQYLSPASRVEHLSKIEEGIYGFTLIFEKIWKSGKTFVGHNCLYDLLYIYEHLVGKLPPEYTKFKEQMRKDGNKFYDTKVIVSELEERATHMKEGTSLHHIYDYFINHEKVLIEKPKISVAEELDNYDLSKPALHEAGFDAYLTGWIFYQLMKKYDKYNELVGRINVLRSYFQIDLATTRDLVRENCKVFVLIVVPYNQYLQREQVFEKRKAMNKEIKELFDKQGILQDLYLHDSFKEIYLEVKDITKLKPISQKLIQLMQSKKIPAIHTLPGFIQVNAKNKEKADSTKMNYV